MGSRCPTVELDKLTGELIPVIEETMQPAHVLLWLWSGTASDKTSPTGPTYGIRAKMTHKKQPFHLDFIH